jgi:hypothetical protein
MKAAGLGLISGALLVSGCSTHEVRREAGSGPRGSLSMALWKRGDAPRIKGGYTFQVQGGRDPWTMHASRWGEPAVVEDLAPGKYRLLLTGRGIEPLEIEVDVRAGERTAVDFDLGAIKKSARGEAIAVGVGKFFLYTVLVVGYVAVWLTLECLETSMEEEEQPCVFCDRHPCVCRRRR